MAILAIDAEKAFDSVYHDHLLFTLEQFGLKGNFIKFVANLCQNASTRMVVNGLLSDDIRLRKGTRQGCPLSPLLFNIAIEPLAITIRQQLEEIRVGTHKLKIALYADDILIYMANTNIPRLLLQGVQNY